MPGDHTDSRKGAEQNIIWMEIWIIGYFREIYNLQIKWYFNWGINYINETRWVSSYIQIGLYCAVYHTWIFCHRVNHYIHKLEMWWKPCIDFWTFDFKRDLYGILSIVYKPWKFMEDKSLFFLLRISYHLKYYKSQTSWCYMNSILQ